MSLSDRLTATPTGPIPTRARADHANQPTATNYVGNLPTEIGIPLESIPADEKAYRVEIERVIGLTIPEDHEVVLRSTRWWGNPEKLNVYCRFDIQPRAGAAQKLDLDDIIRVVKRTKPTVRSIPTTERALVVAWADLQVGKVGSRGGTEELIARVMEKLTALEKHARKVKASSVYLIDVGDCVESFENTAQQGFTNDLSFPEQLRVARRLFTEATVRLSKLHPAMTVAAIPSNHGRWRRGKDVLGKPGDDYGIETLVAVADACTLNPEAFGHVKFVVPGEWEETLAIDIHGTILGIVHGHQANRPEGIPKWWAGQVHGGQPAADADILLTAHFHHLRVESTGRSQHTGRSKWWIQAPTLDNGSDWFRYRSGSDSDPALLTFTVDAQGWDNLTML